MTCGSILSEVRPIGVAGSQYTALDPRKSICLRGKVGIDLADIGYNEVMPSIFFTSDTHFYDEGQILFGSRPFDSVEAMNETLIARWNARVKKDDLVYHLGDFALECNKEQANDLVDRLNGRIALIRGNNDAVAKKIKDRFVLFKDYEELLVDDEDGLYGGKHKVILLHYAMRVWRGSHNGSWHLYGHSHGSLPDDPYSRSFDVGVDCWDFAPISYQQVKETMARKLITFDE